MSEQEKNIETAKEFQPITSQEALDKIIENRLKRERDKYPNYQEYKEKAAAFDEAESARKTQQEKDAERMAELEAENKALKNQELRLRIAEEKGVPHHLLHGDSEEELTKLADELLAFGGSKRKIKPEKNDHDAQPVGGSKPSIDDAIRAVAN